MNKDYELILLTAGYGKRMETSENKILLPLLAEPLIIYSLRTFSSDSNCCHIILVAKKDEIPLLKELAKKEKTAATNPLTFVEGGLERQDSVSCGLKKLKNINGFVMIHDGARPFVDKRSINTLNDVVHQRKAAILGVPVKDTIKKVEEQLVIETVPRSDLWQVQTPQAFSSPLILKAHQRASMEGFLGTDDASLVERLGHSVVMVQSNYDNIKITTPEDLVIGEAILKRQQKEQREEPMQRVGQGYDVHQLVEGRPCIIGGVKIPFEKGLSGHSDADVLIHAIIDALLGAAGKGDIGQLFPDTDPTFEGANSRELLQQVNKLLRVEGFTINNIDATILVEKPKMQPYIKEMQRNLAFDCQMDVERVNVKATTSEKMGFVGRQEGIGAMAICLLKKNTI